MDATFLLFALVAALGFGFVIFIHELGHFLFAKWAGVRVLRFSIGFGPVLLRHQRGETEYVLSALPLGGFVQMAGGEVVDGGNATDGRAEPGSFGAASYSWRAWILLGGVLFNLISSWLILLGLAFWGMPLIRPVVGDVEPTVAAIGGPQVSPAQRLGLAAGDRILAINNEEIRSYEDVLMTTVFAGGGPIRVRVERDGKILELPQFGQVQPVYDPQQGRSVLGISAPTSTLIRGALRPDGTLGTDTDLIRAEDRIVAVNGERIPLDRDGLPVATGQDLERLWRKFGSATTTLTVVRDGQELDVSLVLGQELSQALGLPVRLVRVMPDSPAAHAGLKPQDLIVAADDRPISGIHALIGAVMRAAAEQRPMRLTVVRDGKTLSLSATPARRNGRDQLGVENEPLRWGYMTGLSTGALQSAGLTEQDLLLSYAFLQEKRLVTVRTATQGALRHIGLDLNEQQTTAFYATLHRPVSPGWIPRMFGKKARKSPLDELTAGPVLDPVAGPEGISPTSVRVAQGSGGNAVVDLSFMGPTAAGIARSLLPGEHILGTLRSASGPVLVVASNVGPIREQQIPVPPQGWHLAFGPEETPYAMTGPSESVDIILDASRNMIVKSLTMIPRFFRSPDEGGIDPNKSLSGPIGIFQTLKYKAETTGFTGFLRMVALIGLNLVLVNLLPIPVTDGGQLMFLALEKIRGKPLSAGIRNTAMIIGTVLALMMMSYVIGLDVLRLVGLI